MVKGTETHTKEEEGENPLKKILFTNIKGKMVIEYKRQKYLVNSLANLRV